jgi:translation initiation factor 1
VALGRQEGEAPNPASTRRLAGVSAPRDGKVRVRREVGGRRGKTVTTVSGVPVREAELKALAGRLKKRCGVGGSVKDGIIELQGDHRETVLRILRAEGYTVVLAGG